MPSTWDDDTQYAPDPIESVVRCPYGHPDPTASWYCRAECERMLFGLGGQRERAVARGDTVRARFLTSAIALWRRRAA